MSGKTARKKTFQTTQRTPERRYAEDFERKTSKMKWDKIQLMDRKEFRSFCKTSTPLRRSVEQNKLNEQCVEHDSSHETTRSRVLLEKLIVPRLVKNVPAFMEPKCLLLSSQNPDCESFIESIESSLRLHTLFL
jgi:hypothetical protein